MSESKNVIFGIEISSEDISLGPDGSVIIKNPNLFTKVKDKGKSTLPSFPNYQCKNENCIL